MLDQFNPNRYAKIEEKNFREIIMLRGSGCQWRKCRFCDYHLDAHPDPAENFKLNRHVLQQVTGCYGKLEVINSGSFVDLDEQTMALIEIIAQKKQLNEVHFECHWQHREAIAPLRQRFAVLGVNLKIKIGVETFDALFRESYLVKGIDAQSVAEIAGYYDEVCLLQGLPGQTVESMINDIEAGLTYFERVFINIMQTNGKPIKPDPRVIKQFKTDVYPKYVLNPRVDILLEDTAFGVGGVTTHE